MQTNTRSQQLFNDMSVLINELLYIKTSIFRIFEKEKQAYIIGTWGAVNYARFQFSMLKTWREFRKS